MKRIFARRRAPSAPAAANQELPMSNLAQRLLTAAVVIPILLVSIARGGAVFAFVVTFFAAIGLWEFYNILESRGLPVMRRSGIIFGTVMVALAYFSFGYLQTVLLTAGVMVFSLNQLAQKD